MIPSIITFGCLFYALYIVNPGHGYGSGLPNIFALIPALGISLISWIIYAIFK